MIPFDQSLASFHPIDAPRITDEELSARIAGLQQRLCQEGIKAVWLDASSSLQYYTGLQIGLSERVHGAIIPARGAIRYVSPRFEVPKLETILRIAGDILPWDEHENPCAMIGAAVQALQAPGLGLAIDPATPFRFASRLAPAMEGAVLPAESLIAAQRQVKSPTEIAIIQAAMTASHRVQKAVFDGLHAGLTTTEVCDFIDEAHRRLGLAPLFVAVQFGEATAYPHGVPEAQVLRDGDMVLVDLGGILPDGYRSDITRSYVFGQPTERQRFLWNAERAAHDAAFAAAKLGAPCEAVDLAARASLQAAGFGPGYDVPGLPHRTGHGLGLDIHEDPFMLMGNKTPLEPGMVFSIEPMLCVYGECGIRIEDIVWMGEDGPHWFCPTSVSAEKPF